MNAARTRVIICYWTGRPAKPLWQLLDSMARFPPGAPFDVLVVCNGGDVQPLALPSRHAGHVQVLNRENTGWNLGAWEAGWRASTGHEYLLFLQAECFVRRPDWIRLFEHRLELDRGIGMLGERLMWQQMSWEFVREATAVDLGATVADPHGLLESISTYRKLLQARAIDPGELGTHLVSIILFTRRSLLAELGGFPLIGESYLEAVACEIGLSKAIEARGLRIAQLRDDAFHCIGHTQWCGNTGHTRQLIAAARRGLERLVRRQ